MRTGIAIVLVSVAVLIGSIFSHVTLAQSAPTRTTWEYMIVSYAEYDFDYDGEVEPSITLDQVDFIDLMMVCMEEKEDEREDCREENGIAQDVLLARVGAAGWEMIQYNNTSSEYIYSATFFFKRPS